VSVPDHPYSLGKYEVVAKIARGGMANIYLGRDDQDRVTALKVIRRDLRHDEQYVKMFLDEARILSFLSHPNICKTYDFGLDEGHYFIAMELLLGRTLLDVWQACKASGLTLRADMCAWIGSRAAMALHHAHRAQDERGKPLGLVHRDVNPGNIFLTHDGEVKLFDFGLAKATGRRTQSLAGIAKGKVAYLAPEQVMQEPVDQRADIFSLGATLWEATTMRRLFKRRDDVETLHATRAALVPDPRARNADYPDALWQILKRALDRDPALRHPTGADLSRELVAFIPSRDRAKMPELIAQVIESLFEGERERQLEWLDHVGSLVTTPAKRTMRPPAPVGGVGASRRSSRTNER
jgi:serine/threonine-protein kinase